MVLVFPTKTLMSLFLLLNLNELLICLFLSSHLVTKTSHRYRSGKKQQLYHETCRSCSWPNFHWAVLLPHNPGKSLLCKHITCWSSVFSSGTTEEDKCFHECQGASSKQKWNGKENLMKRAYLSIKKLLHSYHLSFCTFFLVSPHVVLVWQ